jgi:putative DNA primase/helicase
MDVMNDRRQVTRETVSARLLEAAADLPRLDPVMLRCTDDSNALLITHLVGEDLRWCTGIGWLVWDGRRWHPDDVAALACARGIIPLVYMHAAAAEAAGKDSTAEFYTKLAQVLSTKGKVDAALAMARTELQVTARQLDADPYALNVLNGTLSLDTWKLRKHDRADLITKLAPVEFDAAASSEHWTRYIRETCAGQDGLEAFLGRFAGYSLTGDTSEEKLIIPHGPGGFGKGTFTTVITRLMGDYAGSIRAEALMETRGGAGPSGHNEDVARTRGVRMLMSSEPGDRQRLNAGLVKTLTGGDDYAASFKNRPVFEFTPAFKLWMPANHVPKMRADDSGLQRRILAAGFVNRPAKVDTRLKHRLQQPAALSAVLNWALNGYLEWKRQGLNPPACVLAHTTEMWAGLDVAGRFFADCLIIAEDHGTDAELRVTNTDLRMAFEMWANDEGLSVYDRLSVQELGERLAKRGCTRGRVKSGRFWTGARVALAPPPVPPVPRPPEWGTPLRVTGDTDDSIFQVRMKAPSIGKNPETPSSVSPRHLAGVNGQVRAVPAGDTCATGNGALPSGMPRCGCGWPGDGRPCVRWASCAQRDSDGAMSANDTDPASQALLIRLTIPEEQWTPEQRALVGEHGG